MLQSDIKRSKEISAHLKGLGMSSSYKTPKVRAYITAAPAPSDDLLRGIIEPLVRGYAEGLRPPTVEVTPELVKQIVQAMHALPENDKLEVSKGIRNAASFIYGGTKYQTAELMHGAGTSSSGGGGVTFINETPMGTVDGVNTIFTLSQSPQANSLQLSYARQLQIPGVDYTLAGNVITFLTSPPSDPSQPFNAQYTVSNAAPTNTIYVETPAGLVNGSNVNYATFNPIHTVLNLQMNGGFIAPSLYTVIGSGFQMAAPFSAFLAGEPFTIVYI